MKLRFLAVATTLAATGLGVAFWHERAASAALAAQNTRLARQLAELRYEAKQAARQAADFNQRAAELDTQLGSAKVRTTATEGRQAQLAHELTAREQREVALMAELAALRQQLAAAAPGVPPAEPAAESAINQRRIAAMEQQLTELLTRALAEPGAAQPADEVAAPAAPFQVVRVGPRDSFVVLDYGAGQGARPAQVLGLWRGTSEVARVQISDARPRFSLAQVLPATLKGQLQTGDLALLTN